MKDPNKKLSILIALLIVGIGVSFAYFVGKTIFQGSGATITGTTATLEGAKLQIEGELGTIDENIYPGHQTVSKIMATATTKGEDEVIPFNLILKGSNTLNTNLRYTVYRVDEQIELEVKATCAKETKVVNGKQQLSEKCEITNINELGEAINNGEIPKNQEGLNIAIATDQFITATKTAPTTYVYYIVLEYPNDNRNQNDDLKGTFNGTVEGQIINATADVKILSIKVEKEKDKYAEQDMIPTREDKYVLNPDESKCTNDVTLSWDERDWSLLVHNLHKTGTECDLVFDIGDTTPPSQPNVTLADGALNFGGSTDDMEGEVEYYYSIGCTTEYKKGTQVNLTDLSTTTKICVYSEDEAKNRSGTTEKNLNVVAVQNKESENKYYCEKTGLYYSTEADAKSACTYTPTYSCPSGSSLSGKTCSSTSSSIRKSSTKNVDWCSSYSDTCNCTSEKDSVCVQGCGTGIHNSAWVECVQSCSWIDTCTQTVYSCTSGWTLSGSTCTKAATATCSSGGSVSGNNCVVSTANEYYCSITDEYYSTQSEATAACTNYCSSGSLYGSNCYELTD